MNPRKAPDFWLFCATVILLAVGVFMVFDASYAVAGQVKYTGRDSFYYMKRQVVFILIGLAGMFLAMRIRYWKLRSFATIGLLLSIIGLGLVFVPGIGVTANGAARWIRCGGLLTIQPSEIAKLGLVLYLAAQLSSKRERVRDWWSGMVPALVPLVVMGALIMKEPDMGTTVVLAGTTLVMLYMAGAKSRHLTAVVLAGVILGSVLIFMAGYRRERVLSFIDPFGDYYGSGYQVCQSLIALGSGGLRGVGLCEGSQKLFYLPAEHTDFILSVLGEETGLIGTSLIAMLFLLFAARGLSVARGTRDDFGRLLAGGLSVLIGGQALLNMCVVTSSVPATGVPLPFISYGGSALVVGLVCVGILLSVSRRDGYVRGCR